MEMELFNYYSLDECSERKVIKKRLSQLEDEGKIQFKIDGDLLKLDDLDLDEDEVSELIEMFDKYDVFSYPDYEDEGLDSDDEDDEDYYGYSNFDDDDY
jgi:hypothetical protein